MCAQKKFIQWQVKQKNVCNWVSNIMNEEIVKNIDNNNNKRKKEKLLEIL